MWISAMTDKNLVVQHNRIIEARYKLSIGEQRLIKVLVSMIECDDEDFKKYRIHVADLATLLDIKRKDFYAAVKLATKKLIGNVLSFEFEKRTIQAAWLASADYYDGEGFVDLQFAPVLKPFLLQLKQHFTVYELGNVIHLKHTYSIRVYELLKQYEKIGRRKFSIDQLRSILMLSDSQYKLYTDFKKYVLITAQNELSEKTDISFEMIEERKWKTCIAIEFIIKSQSRKQRDFNSEQSTELNNRTINKTEKQEDKPSDILVDLLVNVGVSDKIADSLVKEHPADRIKAAIYYTQAQQKDGKVKNPGGFVVEAIKNEYRDNQAEERGKKEKSLQEAKTREERTKKWDRLKSAYAEAKKAKLGAWRLTLDENELAEYREKFIETANPSPIIRKQKNIMEQMFLGYLQNLMSFPSLREWAQQNNLDISEFEKEIAQEKH